MTDLKNKPVVQKVYLCRVALAHVSCLYKGEVQNEAYVCMAHPDAHYACKYRDENGESHKKAGINLKSVKSLPPSRVLTTQQSVIEFY